MSAVKKRGGPELARLRDLREHEKLIISGLRSFIEVGKHLGLINRDELYKDGGFSSFAEYVEERFDISRQHAYRLIDAARVALSVSPAGDKITSEAAARELVPLSSDRDKMQTVFDEAVRRSDGGRLTAALIRGVREELFPGAPTIDGELVEPRPLPAADPVDSIPDEAKAAIEARLNQTSGPVDTPPADESDEDRPAIAEPGEAEAATSAADVSVPSASPTGDGSSPEESSPVDEPERAGLGVALPAPATNLVDTPVGPMPADFAKKLDHLVPDPNPNREWQKRFLDNVFAAAKAMRGYSGAEIAEKADDQLRAEFARFVGDMDSLLRETSAAQLATVANNVRPLRRVQ